jgi:hypothetical protein
MTSAEFAEKFPKPWHFVQNKCTFTLTAANGAPIAQLGLYNFHVGIPQQEWNRHVAAGLNTGESIPVLPKE